MNGAGMCLLGHVFTHGISPCDESAGVVEWQILRTPFMDWDWPPLATVSGMDCGKTALRVIAMSTTTVCHLMSTI
jgi:hypothetical protein